MLGKETVDATLDDWRGAPLRPQILAALGLIEKLTSSPEDVGPSQMEELRAAGVTDEAVEQVAVVCALFNIIDRVADALDFHLPTEEGYQKSADSLLKFGYSLPKPLRGGRDRTVTEGQPPL